MHVCMCSCVHVCMCACVHVCMCACVCVYHPGPGRSRGGGSRHLCVCVSGCLRVYVCAYDCTSLLLIACACACVHVYSPHRRGLVHIHDGVIRRQRRHIRETTIVPLEKCICGDTRRVMQVAVHRLLLYVVCVCVCSAVLCACSAV